MFANLFVITNKGKGAYIQPLKTRLGGNMWLME